MKLKSSMLSVIAGLVIAAGILVIVVPNIIAHQRRRDTAALAAAARKADRQMSHDPDPAAQARWTREGPRAEPRPGPQGAPGAEVSAGMMAPGFALKNLKGQTVSLRSLRGKVVFLNVWATWCEPCRMEMPSIQTLYDEFQDNPNIIVLAISEDEGPASVVADFMKKNGYHFPVLLDPKNRITDLYNLAGVPETFIIDRTGRIVAHHMGAFDWSRSDVKEALEELINSREG